MNDFSLAEALYDYRRLFPGELAAQRIAQLVDARGELTDRHTFDPGHLTASAWILSPYGDSVLLLHHRKLDKWLQPGGHIDPGEPIFAAALREAREETGLGALEPVFIPLRIFDVDVHTIPQNPREPSHQHFDVRFLLRAKTAWVTQDTTESKDLQWVALDQVHTFTQEESVLRMVSKSNPQRRRAA